jgi:hypothetical protein
MTNYISVENQKLLDERYRLGVFLALIFGASVVFLMLIAHLIAPSTSIPGSEKWVQPIFIAVIVIGLAVVSIRRILMSQAMMLKLATGGANAVIGRLSTTTIICLALAELVGILGLVFYLLTGYFDYSWRLGVISLLLILYSFPRRGEWGRIISRITQ